jgi:hypothetical protein
MTSPYEDLVCLTIDVEWAHPEVLADLTDAIAERGLRATLFCTHPGVPAGVHERALHPNFRRNGDTMRMINREHPDALNWPERRLYDCIIRHTKSFCPEAVGTRSHSLFYESDLLPVYQEHGLRYDSSVFLPLMPNIVPVKKEFGVVEFPIYYMDHWDLMENATDFSVAKLQLEAPGLKVFDFHPNIVYTNARTNADYLDDKVDYFNPAKLATRRRTGRGARTLFFELLDHLAARPEKVAVLADLSSSSKA